MGAPVLSLAVAPDGTVLAGTRGGSVLLRSTNNGATFVAAASGLPPGAQILTLAVSPDFQAGPAAGAVFAGTNLSGVFRSINGGLPVDALGELPGIGSLAVSPAFATDQTVFLGAEGEGVFRSTNGGTGWSGLGTPTTPNGLAHFFVFALAVGPTFSVEGTVLAGTSGGVFSNTLDTVPPSGTVTINSAAANTNNPAVTLSFAVTNVGSVVNQMRVAESASALAATPYKPFSPTDGITLSGADGTKTVFAQFRDADGIESAVVSDTITLDTAPPTGSVTIAGGALSTGTATVGLSFTATDTLSAVTQMRFAQSAATLAATPYKPFSATDTISLTGADGTKTVFAQFRDAAGNESAMVSDNIVLSTLAATLAAAGLGPIPPAFVPTLEAVAPGVVQIARPPGPCS